MNYRELGKSGIMVHPLAMGCWAFGGGDYWGEQSQHDVDAVVARALDLGVNLFDTAEYYNGGDSESSLGLALGARRKEAVICTKVTPDNAYRQELIEHCEESLKRLKTDYIDVYLLHWPINYNAISAFTSNEQKLAKLPTVEEAFEALAQLKKDGKIRSFGISNFGVLQMEEALAIASDIDVNQITYNIFSRAIEAAILPFCVKRDISVIGTMTLQQGLLTGAFKSAEQLPVHQRESRHFSHDGKAGAESEIFEALPKLEEVASGIGCTLPQLAIAWAIYRQGVAAALIGSRSVGELDENFKAASIALDDDIAARVDAISKPVSDFMGDSPDFYMTGEKCRIS